MQDKLYTLQVEQEFHDGFAHALDSGKLVCNTLYLDLGHRRARERGEDNAAQAVPQGMAIPWIERINLIDALHTLFRDYAGLRREGDVVFHNSINYQLFVNIIAYRTRAPRRGPQPGRPKRSWAALLSSPPSRERRRRARMVASARARPSPQAGRAPSSLRAPRHDRRPRARRRGCASCDH